MLLDVRPRRPARQGIVPIQLPLKFSTCLSVRLVAREEKCSQWVSPCGGVVTKQHKFTVKLFGQEGLQVAALKPPFDVVEAFQRKGRVPVNGTINGFPFRSSLMNMGQGHMMVVNSELRAGAKGKAGDVVSVVMELDENLRKVEIPPVF